MESMRNIIRLKNLPSNAIEEAIIIFKNNKKARKHEYSSKFKQGNRADADENDFIIKEAELIISDYLEKSDDNELELKRKNKALKFVCILLGVLFVTSILL